MAKSLLKDKIPFAEESQGLMFSCSLHLEMICSFEKQGIRRQGNIHFKSALQCYNNFFLLRSL